MPKRSSDELFKLIKSLSKKEKIYFKTQQRIVGRSTPVYMQLFEFIDKQKQCNDNKILKRFKDLNIQRLSAQKNYLYNLILEQISFLNEGHIKAISDLLVKADVLYDKGLYVQSQPFVQKAKSIAVKFEFFAELLSILNFERKLIVNNTPNATELEKLYKDNYKQKQIVLKNIADIELYQVLSDQVFGLHLTQTRLRNREQLKKIKRYIADPLLAHPPSKLSLKARELIYTTKGVLFASLNDYKSSYKWFKEKLKVTQLLSHKGSYFKENYMKTLGNYIFVCFQLKKYKEAWQHISKLKEIKTNEKTLNGLKQDFVYTNIIFLHLATFQYSKIILLENEIENALIEFRDVINNKRKAVIYFHIAFANFCENNFEGSKKWCQKLISEINDSESKEFVSACRILLLIIYYESEELNFIQSLVRNTYRFFKTRDQLFGMEALLLSFMKKDIYKINSKEEEKQAFIVLRAKFVEVLKDPMEQNFLKIIDLFSWVDSKARSCAFVDVLKEKK